MQQQAFDTYSQTYDVHFTNSRIGIAQRNSVYKGLLKHLNLKSKRVLEINCGTGEDAAWLAKLGNEVLATDISIGMIDVAKNKLKNTDVKLKQLDSKNIGTLFPNRFDLIFSNFGGINCLSNYDLIEFENACKTLQLKSNQLAFVIMGTQCIWERLFFKYKKEFQKSNRRKGREGIDTLINGFNFKTYYFSPSFINNLFKDDYKKIALKPIGLFVPPSYLESYFVNKKKLFRFLILLDEFFCRFSCFSNYADHYLIVLEKK